MARQITIITPENIALTLEEAGLATRFGALLIDIVLQITITLIVLIVIALISISTRANPSAGFGRAFTIAAGFLIWFGYFIFFEAIWNGQTPGKRVFGLRVMRDGGFPLDVFSAATRNLIRIADFLPFGYLIGALAVFFSPEYRRLGDMAAGTIVIKERMIDPRAAFRTGLATPLADGAAMRLPDTVSNPLDALSPDELTLFRRFALRRWEMTPDDAERLAYRLIAPRINQLNLTFTPGEAPHYADLTGTLVADADRRESELEKAGQ